MKYKLLRFCLLGILAMFCGTVFADQVTMKYSGDATTNMTGENDAALLGLDATAWSVVGDKGANSNFPGLNKAGDFRLYYSANGGNTITVSSLNGATINNITMTFTGDSYGNVSVTVEGKDVSAEDGVYAINSSSFVLGNANTSNVQVRISEVVINYTAGSGPTDTRTETTVTLSGEYLTTGTVGEELALPTATVMAGETALEALPVWSSSNEEVAIINDGKVKLLSAGTSTIKAAFEGDASNKPSSASYTLTVKKPIVIEDGVFDFSMGSDYGSGLEQSSVKIQESTWTAGNVVMEVSGRNCWYTDNKTLRIYKNNAGEGEEGNAGTLAISVPEGKLIKKIVFTGNTELANISADKEAYNTETFTWEGSSNAVTFRVNDGAGTVQIYTITVTYEDEATEPVWAWADIKADFTNQSFFTEADKEGATAGLKMNADGTFTRVEADAVDANAVISGKYHSDEHGISNFSAQVKVEGPVKITFGTCAWGGNVTVKDAAGTEVVPTFSTNTGACYHNGKDANVVSAYYKGEATTLTIAGGSYVPYFAVEKVDISEIPSEAKISFDIAGVECEGVAPAEITAEIGSKITIPANRTLYKEFYTLTAWTDAEGKLYKAGDEVTVSEDLTLKPVFAENANPGEQTEPATIVWDFQQKNGAPVLNYQNATGIYVAQVTVNDVTADRKLDFDTNNGGKIANGSWQDWCQMNGGTKLTIPAQKGMTVSIESYSATTTTTIAGSTDYTTEGNVVTYTYEGTAETIDIVIGDGSYFRYVKAVYPVPAADEEEFVDIKADFTNGSFFTAEETNATTAGLKMNEDGTFTRVAADDETANAVITGKYHSDEHGISNFSATVKVLGTVKVSMGTCAWGGDVTVTNAEGTTVATFNTNTGACYHNDKENNIVFGYYKVNEPTTLTISGGAYTPYFAVEAISPELIPNDVKFVYDITSAECEGVAPEAEAIAIGKEYTLPKNYTLYKEGHTLTGWTDGENTYAPGEAIKAPEAEEITLTPVFTANEVTLADRTEPVTVKFNFRRDAGAPTVAYQNATGIWVAQATVNGKNIDVKADFDTTDGKFANGNWTDWAQLNGGTKWTVPSCKGATVSMEAYSEITTTTIDGQTDYTSGKTISYEIAGAAETVDVVIGDGSYYRYIQVVLPVVQSQGGGESYENAVAKVNWPFNDSGNVASYVAEPAGAFSTVAVNTGDLTITGVASRSADDLAQGISFIKFKPAGTTTAVQWVAKPAAGLTFTPTKISMWIQRFGTDAENGVTITAKVGEGEAITLGNFTAPRANKNQTDDKYGKSSNWTNHVEIELTAEQQVALTSGDELTLSATVGVGSTKEGGFSDVIIEGLVNGTKADVAMYTLATVVAPEEAGSINVYPKADTYEEGSEVKLTATENFGYDFVNWTAAAGEVVSEEPVFTYTMNSDATLTANFKAVETYELALTVDGTNDYMVTVNPAPEVVGGKWMYEAGTAVQLNANQYEGLVTFTNWSDGETSSSKLVSMTENIQLTAYYAQADIIAGWDFYTTGSNGRKADFAAQDNDADALNLVNTETGETQGWLDKSWLGAGGYESFKGAAVNWREGTKNGDVGNWHWQTKINAEAFTDINVQFQMLYNYNAYQTYNAEFSLDGENWTKFGSITMTGAKAEAQFNEQLPAEANNQKDLFIRMLADKTSNVDGAASANDGNTLAMFFITGTPKLVDDGTAPVLVSTVPADGATGASASGKIVLTFDERIKMTEGAVAYINNTDFEGLEMQNPTKGVVSGKTITFEYKGLEYTTQYAFTLAGNTVADLTDNFLTEPINLTFTTMARPSVDKKMYDYVVGNVDELMAAIDAAQKRSDKNVRYRIFIKNGEYTIPLSSTMKTVNGYEVPECITFINTTNVSFIGESRDGVIITNGIDKNETFAGQYGTTSKYDGIGNSDVLQISGSDYYFQDLTIESGMDDATGRDLAVQDKATRTIYKNTGLRGYQDTWTSNNDNGLYYFEGGYVRGRTDFMCGKGDAFFNGVEIRQIAGGYAAVPSKSIKYGYTYKDCVINGEGSGVDGNYTLGRPWGSGTPVALWINTKMNVVPSAIGWNEMSGGWPKRFAEYNSMTSTGSVIDLSGRKKVFGDGHENNPVLTAEEALEAGNLHNMFGEWDPTLATEQAPIPANVKIEGLTLTWDNSDYALLWAVCKNGSVIGFTTEPTFTVDDQTAAYTVRAANEMGGLSEASDEAVSTSTAIMNVETAQPASDGSVYTIQGIRVDKARRGLYIVNGRKIVVK
jgi:hypothetical protein